MVVDPVRIVDVCPVSAVAERHPLLAVRTGAPQRLADVDPRIVRDEPTHVAEALRRIRAAVIRSGQVSSNYPPVTGTFHAVCWTEEIFY